MFGVFMDNISAALALADVFERFTRGLRNHLDTRTYQEAVFNLVKDALWDSSLSKDERLAILGRLENAGSDPLLQELCTCETQSCFENVLKRLGFSGEDVSPDLRSGLVERLRGALFLQTAKPHEVVAREDVLQGHRMSEQLLAGVEDIRDHLQISPVRPIDPEVGNTAVLAQQVSFPLLVGWSARLNRALNPDISFALHRDPLHEYEALTTEARAGNGAGKADLQTEFENVAVLCVEREFDVASSRLQGLRHRIPAAPMEQQVLYYRLKGAILRSLGNRSSAREAYEKARSLMKSTEAGRNGLSLSTKAWLERQLEFDLLSVDAQDLDLWDSVEERAKLVRSIPAWHRHPAVDAAIGSFIGCLAREWVAAERATESTYRVSTLEAEAIGHYNRALALCYLSGDFRSARDVRLQLVTALAPHLDPNREGLLRLAASELLATDLPREVEAFLSRHADSVAGMGVWDEIAVRQIGVLDVDAYDDDVSRTTLAVIEHMAPYLHELTLERLNEDFLQRSIRFLHSGFEPFVLGRGYRENSFIQAYTRIFLASPEQVLEFVDALAGHSLTGPFSFWEVLAGYEWRTDDAEAAQRALDYLIAGANGLEGKPPALLLQLLRNIIQAIPTLRPLVVEWLVDVARDDAQIFGPFLLFTGRYEEAVQHARRWTEGFVMGVIERLDKASAKGGVSFGGPMWKTAALAAGVRAYEEQFSRQDVVGYIEQLLGAVKSPSVLAADKADVYRAVLGLVRLLEGETLTAVRERIYGLSPLEVPTKTIDLQGPWYSPNSDEASLALLLLRQELGLEASTTELLLVLRAIGAPANTRIFEAACDVAEALVMKEKSAGASRILDTVYGKVASGDKNLARAARALRFLVRTLSSQEEPLTSLALEELSKVAGKGHPFLVQTVLHEAGASWDSLDDRSRAQLTDSAAACLGHAHRHVRYWAGELLRRASPAPCT